MAKEVLPYYLHRQSRLSLYLVSQGASKNTEQNVTLSH